MEKKEKPSGKNPSVTVSTLAKLFNLTSVRIQQLAADGVVIRSARGRYELWQSVKNYIEYLQERKVNQWDSDEENPTEIKKHQLRRTKEEADKLELANARTRGELVEVAKVKRLGEQVMSGIKTKILNMPLTDDEKDKCLRDLLSMKDLDYSDK
jgi:phage terminase Nu1 subunit (DNA packaging protein)|nr:Phage DNA packaging protein, Nu1 subunit of terminase (COG4220) [uncultured Mediterranean phage uvMED]|tara:strand:- start:14284 stop:14745 length:462 start_codon:yes stop_codon:yes gene_type:complete